MTINGSTYNQSILEDLVVETTEALFEHYEVDVRHARGLAPEMIWKEELALAGIIGFTSDHFRGSLVLAMGAQPLRAVEEEVSRHRDWIQELSNQLLGRMKNRLLAYGVDLVMTTPLSLRGLHLTLEPNSVDSNLMLFHTEDDGAVCVMLDGEMQRGFELVRDENEDNLCPNEGELMLF